MIGCGSTSSIADGPTADIDAGADAAIDAPVVYDAAPASPDAGQTRCTVHNDDAQVAARGGFLEVCADPTTEPAAVCGDGSPYKWSYRPAPTGSSQGLLVFFQGGGACSDYVSCWGEDGKGGTGRTVTTMSNDRAGAQLDPTTHQSGGILDLGTTANALVDYDVVFSPYCTGDLGQTSREEVLVRPASADPSAPAQILTYFHGRDNLQLAVAFAERTFASPPHVVIAGSSAGGYVGLAATPMVVAAYPAPATTFAYIGDAAAGIGLTSFDSSLDSIVSALDGTGTHRFARFVQFSFQADATQRTFAKPAYQPAAAFQAALQTELEGRASRHPTNYRYFAPPGTCHVVLQSPALYQKYVRAGDGTFVPASPPVMPNPDLTLDGVGLDAWLRAVVEGDGPFGADVADLAGPWGTVLASCPLPTPVL